MSLAYPGLTHCSICGSRLKDYEYSICEKCEENNNKEKVLNIFNNMDEYEQKALEEFIHKIGKEYKKKEIEKQIKNLQNELEKKIKDKLIKI